MNRIIKFRAWVADDNKMYDVLGVFRNFADEDFCRAFLNKEQSEGEPVNYRMINGNILMQFTGLADSAGTPIYEGDIVTFDLKTKFECDSFVGKVLMDEYMWTVETTSGNMFSLNRISKSKVVGDVYTTPELLK